MMRPEGGIGMGGNAVNLMNDHWIPAIRGNGARCLIAPYEITLSDIAITELAAPRPDFQGALYQFLIGLLQTAFAPKDHEEWLVYWRDPPTPERLGEAFRKYQSLFQVDRADGAAFMQDFALPDGERKPIASLLIDAPGAKTRKDNLDLFIKGGEQECMCPTCAAIALFTLQINAPSGGQGHRVGLRGGGPLTTLIVPQESEPFQRQSLWRRLWANVLTREQLDIGEGLEIEAPLPWSRPTRLSDKTGVATLPGDVHTLQMYWAMPRRIRLEFEILDSASCMICGESCTYAATTFRTRNFGNNYEGPWLHPLTPYRFDPKHKKPPLSLKGQPGGIGYRHWLGLLWQDDANGDHAARAVTIFNDERSLDLDCDNPVRLWCFGYDMDNMKARCWYESTMPVILIPQVDRERFLKAVEALLDAAKEAAGQLRYFVKTAWFSRPKEIKGDMSLVDQEFWNDTEPFFYQSLNQALPTEDHYLPVSPVLARQWAERLRREALRKFDQWALEGDPKDLDMKRIIRARNGLRRALKKAKAFTVLDQIAETETEVR
jgi:CRISPR system Cascade subunit CasA